MIPFDIIASNGRRQTSKHFMKGNIVSVTRVVCYLFEFVVVVVVVFISVDLYVTVRTQPITLYTHIYACNMLFISLKNAMSLPVFHLFFCHALI